jgi:WhiB family redox-sensing transcriptional regulator
MTKNNDYNWRDDAACKGLPAVWWFPEVREPDGFSEAIKICKGCPVIQECLYYGLQREQYGIYGGTTETERMRMRKDLGITFTQFEERQILPPEHKSCGTNAGYINLKRIQAKFPNEPIVKCLPCYKAHSDYTNSQEVSPERQARIEEYRNSPEYKEKNSLRTRIYLDNNRDRINARRRESKANKEISK